MGELKKPPLDLWLNGVRKQQMGQRLEAEIRRAKTTKAALAAQIGCSRATLTYACKQGIISVELLAEVCKRIGASLDYVVFGKYPTADPEFLALLDRLKSAATRPHH
jgi:transcriptional regulator with XRE-family HTH domain